MGSNILNYEDIKELEEFKDLVINKKKIRLLFPFAMNKEVKKLGAIFDIVNKIWYYPSINNKLPDELEPYRCYYLKLSKEDYQYYKSHFKYIKYERLNDIY